MKRRFLTLVDLVAADAIDHGDSDEATRLIDVGIAEEPLDEGRYASLCAVLESQGRTSAAREVARRAEATFADAGGVTDIRLRRLIATSPTA